MTDSPTDRRAALRLELARRSQALDAADRACHERQEIARALAEAPDAAAARGMIVALDYAIDAEQAAEDALDGKAPAPDGAKGLTLEELYAPDPPPKEKKPRKPRAKGVGPGQTSAGIPADPAPEPRPLARYVCGACGVEGECSPAGEPTPPLCYQCKKAREDANEGNGFLPGFEAPAKTPTATDERM